MDDFNKGSVWRVWDLQVQTILDDNYLSLESYYADLKDNQPEAWAAYINKVGGETNALLYDSKQYFTDNSVPEDERCTNYARNLFAFIEVFKPHLGLLGFTDHNYHHALLLDKISEYGQKAKCKCLCGVEINASGVHILVYFDKPPYNKPTFSEGIKTFLDSINVNQPKKDGVLTVSSESVASVIQEINKLGGIYVFPHCNSDNGLFQERARTDRTYLADIYNGQNVILLQASNYDSAKKTSDYINSKTDALKAKHVFSISPDSRCLLDIGKDDNKGFYTWVKAAPTFQGLKQFIIENDRVEITDIPLLNKRVQSNKTKFIKELKVKKVDGVSLADVWFDNFRIELNSGLVAVIGNKGSGKSAVADILGLCGNTYQDPKYFSFLTSQKFRKPRPANLSEKFEAFLTWEDGTVLSKRLNQDPDKNLPERVKYIPQNFLESICANVESEQFEKELKQIIYHHTPTEQRYGKASLDELIDYKSNLVNDEIQALKGQLSKLNLEIVFLEQKSTDAYKASIENQIKLKQDELKAHQGNLPVKPQNQEEGTSGEDVNRLNALRSDLEKVEEEIKNDRNSKTTLGIQVEELSQAAQHFNNLRDQLQKQLDPNNAHIKTLTAHNIVINDVFSFIVNSQPILDKIANINSSIAAINLRLDETLDQSNAFKRNVLVKQIADGQELLDKPAKEQQKYLSDLKAWTDKKVQIEGDKATENSLNYFIDQLEYLQTKLQPELEKLYTDRKNIVETLFEKKQELTSERKKLFQPVSKFIEDFKELKDRYDVKFDVALEFRSFHDNFFGFINQAKVGNYYGREEGFKKLTDLTEKAHFDNAANFAAFAEEIIDTLKLDRRGKEPIQLEISSQLKAGKQLNELYDYIFSFDYLQPIYNLKLGDKTLQELSPGERGALLLIFYLILDDDDIPLIIDQPEENLDNESVYHILVHFIKKVKEKRQIIIVTHNPNLAVVCDADQIIHMHIDKKNKNSVGFTSGAIEDLETNKSVVNVLEGTLPAFNNRDSKYIRFNAN